MRADSLKSLESAEIHVHKTSCLSISAFLISIYFLIIPFESFLASATGSFIRYLGVGIILGILLEAISHKRRIKISRGLIPLLIWFSISFISVLWAPIYEDWQRYILIYGRNFALLIICTSIQFSKNEVKLFQRSIVTGGIIAGGFLLFSPGEVQGWNMEGRHTLSIFGSYYDPNYMAGMLLLPICLLYNNFIQDISKKKNSTIISMLFLIILLGSAFSTGSRGGLLGISVSMLIITFGNIFSKNKTTSNKIKIVSLTVIISALIIISLPDTIKNRFSIYSLSGNLDAGSNRILIWKYGWEIYKKNYLLGTGIGSFATILSSVYEFAGAHNIFLLVLVETGIIGSVFFIYYLGDLLLWLLKSKKYVYIGIYIGLLVICFFLDSLSAKFFWNALIIIGIYRNEKQNIYENNFLINDVSR